MSGVLMKRFVFPVLAVLALVSMTQMPARAAAQLTISSTSAPTVPGLGGGYAYSVSLSSQVQSLAGQSGLYGLVASQCAAASGTQYKSQTSLAIPKVVTTGAFDDTLTVSYGSTTNASISSSAVSNLNLLNGLITASQLNMSNRLTVTGSGSQDQVTASAQGLKVGSTAITTLTPNQHVTLNNLGYAVVDEQISISSGTTNLGESAKLIDLWVTQTNQYNLPVGSRIIIAGGNSTFMRASGDYWFSATGYGFGILKQAGYPTFLAGPKPVTSVGCTGGSTGATSSGFGSTYGVTSGSEAVYAYGSMQSNSAFLHVLAQMNGLNMFNGMIKADSVQVDSRAYFTGTVSTVRGTVTATNLVVNGQPVTVKSTWQKYTLPGIGILYLNGQDAPPGPSAVQETDGMIVDVTSSNSYGLPIGSQVIVGFTMVTAEVRG
jgi:hypothetical protein